MKKALVVPLIVVLGGCGIVNAAVQKTCATERSSHAFYIKNVAPFRSADRVALELTNYTQIEAACVTGDPLGVLLSLVNAAKSLRK